MPVSWNKELEDQVLDLRENYGLEWEQVRLLLKMETPDVPRIRASRLRAKGRLAPPKGKYTYDFSVLDPAAETEPASLAVSAGTRVKSKKMPPSLDYEVAARFKQHEYSFDGKEYYFPINGTIVSIPKDTWEQIIAEYSSEGGDMTQHEVAMRYGMHKKVLEACLRIYGHFKARPPVTREGLKAAVEGDDLEPLYDRAIEVEEAAFSRTLASRRLRHLEEQNRQLKQQLASRDELRDFLKDCVQDIAPVAPDRIGPPTPTKIVHFAPLYDLHIGMQVAPNSGSWDAPYDSDIACAYLEEYAKSVASEVLLQSWGLGAKRVILGLGGDFFHAFLGRTEKGTPLEKDRPDRVVFRLALQAMVRAVTTLRTVAEDVLILSIPGNHDHLFAELFEETLAAKFEGVPGVTVPNRQGIRDYFVEGDSLHVLDHGKGFERLSDKALLSADTLARAVAPQAYYDVRRVYLYVGHTHHHEVKAHGEHLEVVRVPTFAHTTKYEESLVLPGVPQGWSATLDARGRISSPKRHYLPVPQLDRQIRDQ